MASNFFTRPHGLHPTPSACYPPPPPPLKGIIVIVLNNTNPIIHSPSTIAVELQATNPIYQTGVPVTSVWTVPNGTEFPPTPVLNNQQRTHNFAIMGAVGTYTCSVKLTWPNGQTRTTPFIYTIIP